MWSSQWVKADDYDALHTAAQAAARALNLVNDNFDNLSFSKYLWAEIAPKVQAAIADLEANGVKP
jgi:hypothetical protein